MLKEGRKDGWMRVAENKWMDEVNVCVGREGRRKDEASRETPPCCCCCWREISLFYFQPCLFAFLLLFFSLLVSLFLYPSLVFVLLVLSGAFPLLSLFLSSLLSYHFPLLFPLSSCINYLSYEVPYLSYLAPVDLLS